MIVPPIKREIIDTLTPDTCFIAISKRVGSQFEGYESFNGGGEGEYFIRLRNLVTSLVRDGRIRDTSLVIYKEPFKRENSDGYCMARYILDCYWRGEDVEAQFQCLLVTGSPKNNRPYTLVLQNLMIQKL